MFHFYDVSILPFIKLKCFYSQYYNTVKKEEQHQNQMSTAPATNFDGIHVSKGFVHGLQGQVLKLEQMQQSLFRQLEHANKLASEYHAAAVEWQQKYETTLRDLDEMRHAFERETMLRIAHEHDITYLERILAEKIAMSRSPSPSPARVHCDSEPVSPVSISSSSPGTPMCDLPRCVRMQDVAFNRSARHREYCKEQQQQQQQRIEEDTAIPFDENDERIVMRDGKKFKQTVQYGFGNMPWYEEKEMTTSDDSEDSDDSDAIEYHYQDEDDGIDWEQRERDDWTESIRAESRASSEERDN